MTSKEHHGHITKCSDLLLKTVLFSPTYSHLLYHKVTHVPITTSLVGSWLHILHFARQLILADALNHARTLLIGSWKLVRTYHNFRLKNLFCFLSHRRPHIPIHPQHCEIDSETMEKHQFKKFENSPCKPLLPTNLPLQKLHLREPLVVALARQGPWCEPNAPESWSWPQWRLP